MSEPTKEALAAVSDQYKDLPETARSCAVVSRAREIDDITHLPKLLDVVEAARHADHDYRTSNPTFHKGMVALNQALAAYNAAKGDRDE